jgi:hypothetical protein
VESKVIPVGLAVAGRLANRRARPSAPMPMIPGCRPGWRAKIMPRLNEQPAPATASSPARVIYGSGPITVE